MTDGIPLDRAVEKPAVRSFFLTRNYRRMLYVASWGAIPVSVNSWDDNVADSQPQYVAMPVELEANPIPNFLITPPMKR
ncbi:hypothetical protein JMJ77_0004123 [Colletotrichum scovillei]|uniref:Uncharacterized protein n=1 Tax=Colletotrichum scovillei TaxID=1209932 RepID=A0A9P7R0S7_9PEZI|nr:hypothetical protein JMJ77_0004123 [Colletotrichum scovillei]KAG7049373.1 hypothetical protein JMJ78_0013356 [Colletotrichum scovillei]KAG7064115.1 hypothetical protein JMJ76_0007163 [Colletotrichum scovillei]